MAFAAASGYWMVWIGNWLALKGSFLLGSFRSMSKEPPLAGGSTDRWLHLLQVVVVLRVLPLRLFPDLQHGTLLVARVVRVIPLLACGVLRPARRQASLVHKGELRVHIEVPEGGAPCRLAGFAGADHAGVLA